MPKLTIDGNEIEVQPGSTVIQACEQLGVEIPRFCYHERLEIAGNCRMCLVEIEGGPPKPAASCALPVADGMVVHTNTPMVKKAREGVMEFLLANHPLDCPICDQGGECDLQDQAFAYGSGVSRYAEHKRSVQEKYMGPLVKTQMTRCIHCTRCVRFITDVAGVPELGAVGRGENMEITTYIEKALTSELSANIIDLCPVGALTSRPYAFKGRPWELRKTESIDVLDAVGSNIRIDARGNAVMRVLPRLNEEINEEWISDKTRYACDGLGRQRIDRPYIRKGGRLVATNWSEALDAAAAKIQSTVAKDIAALAGGLADVESMFVLKEIMSYIGSDNLDVRQAGEFVSTAERGNYIFNTGIADIEQADLCLLIGANPRTEAPILNSRIRKAQLNNNLKVAYIGDEVDLSYYAKWLGNSPKILAEIASGTHEICEHLRAAERPMIILGTGALNHSDAEAIYDKALKIAFDNDMVKDNWNGFNILPATASFVGGLDVGFFPASESGMNSKQIISAAQSGNIKLLISLGADEIDYEEFHDSVTVIYIGHHGDVGAQNADIILPAAAYTEKNAWYVNLEGRLQSTFAAVAPPNEAKEDWRIFRALGEKLGIKFDYNTHKQLREVISGKIELFSKENTLFNNYIEDYNSDNIITEQPFKYHISNFYLTDPISRASKTMIECSQQILQAKNGSGLSELENNKNAA